MSVLKITKYLNFTELPSTGKTKIIDVGNNSGEKLGIIKWSGGWRKYCYFTISGLEVQYDAGCLQDIIDFIKQLMEDRK